MHQMGFMITIFVHLLGYLLFNELMLVTEDLVEVTHGESCVIIVGIVFSCYFLPPPKA